MDSVKLDSRLDASKRSEYSAVNVPSGTESGALRDLVIGVLIIVVILVSITLMSPTNTYRAAAVASESLAADSSTAWKSIRTSTEILAVLLIVNVIVMAVVQMHVKAEYVKYARLATLVVVALASLALISLGFDSTILHLNWFYWLVGIVQVICALAAGFVAYMAMSSKNVVLAGVVAAFGLLFAVMAFGYITLAMNVKTGADASEIIDRIASIIEQDF